MKAKIIKIIATVSLASICSSFSTATLANPSSCISITTGSAGQMTFASTFKNSCDKCVKFSPRAVGLGGSPDLPMGALFHWGR